MIVETRVQVNWAEVARLLEQKIMARMHESLNYWDEVGMRAMVVADAAGGLRVCELLAEGSIDSVNDALWEMDTAPREDVLYWIEEIVGTEALRLIW